MFHSEIRIKLGNKNTVLPQILPVLWSSCVLYWSWRPRPQSHCTGNGKELLSHLAGELFVTSHEVMKLFNIKCTKTVTLQCSMWYCDKFEIPTQTTVTLEMWRSCLAICWAMCHFTSNAQWLKSNSEQVLSEYASSSIVDFSKYLVVVWLWKKINSD